jgi:CheY-like chemotaxis protein
MRRFEPEHIVTGATEQIPGGTETILVVEDEQMLQALVRELLENHGYTVHTASDGAEAVEIYMKLHDRIDLVLTDIGLPKLSGWDVCRQVIARNPKAKVLVASGYIDPNAKSDLKDSAAKGFLHKPYLPEDILKQIRDVLDAS